RVLLRRHPCGPSLSACLCFSRRRRHTRSKRDWRSDVCSSDLEWEAPLPVVTITGTTGNRSRDQSRQACIDHGTTYQTVETLPFLLDTSQATDMRNMFRDCSSLTSVPDMDTSNVTYMYSLFQ